MAPSGVLVTLQMLPLTKAHCLFKILKMFRARMAELCLKNNFRIISSHVFSFLLQHTVFKLNHKFAIAGNMIQVGSIYTLLLALQLSSGVSVHNNSQLHSKEKWGGWRQGFPVSIKTGL